MTPLEDRFWAKVDTSGECWVWIGLRSPRQYGLIAIGGRKRKTHRIAWELVHGPIPAGLNVCHRCDNPPCVRPEHLFLGTDADNLRDAASKGRMSRGSGNRKARLTEADVHEIKALLGAGLSPKEIAGRFPVRPEAVRDIRSGLTWDWLDKGGFRQ